MDSYSNIDNELNEMVRTIIPPSRLNPQELLEYAKNLYNIQELDDVDSIENNLESISRDVYSLISKFFEEGKLNNPIDKEQALKYRHTFGRLIGVNHYLSRILKMNILSRNVLDPDYDYSQDVRPSEMESVNVFDFEKMTNFQKLIFGLKHKIKERNLRKFGDMCMTLMKTEEGFNTKYWDELESIKEFCYQNTNFINDHVLWQCATNPPSNIMSVINRLIESEEGFKTVVKDRHLFSFKNGIYETNWKDPIDKIEKGKWHPYIEEYKGIEKGAIEDSRVSCKYFSQQFEDFSHTNDWYDIPTPYFQSILDYQEFPEEVSRWMYILVIGRILYEVGEMDDWQVIPFLKGKAGTGKSSVLVKICKEFFHTSDVGVLSNNIEKKFGLSALAGKSLFIAPEIKGNLGLEQTEFQSIVSGEDVQIAVKNKTSYSYTWKVPGVMAGNQAPNYSDNSGSVSRRVPVFEFAKTVKHTNTQLGKFLKEEIPILIQKGNRAYLEAVKTHGTKSLWDNVLPDYFKRTSEEMQEQSNALAAFLHSGYVQLGEDCCTPMRVFLDSFNQFTRENNFDKAKWVKTYYNIHFEKKNIRESNINPFDGSRGKFYVGVKIVNEDNLSDDEEDDLV